MCSSDVFVLVPLERNLCLCVYICIYHDGKPSDMNTVTGLLIQFQDDYSVFGQDSTDQMENTSKSRGETHALVYWFHKRLTVRPSDVIPSVHLAWKLLQKKMILLTLRWRNCKGVNCMSRNSRPILSFHAKIAQIESYNVICMNGVSVPAKSSTSPITLPSIYP